MLRFAANLSLLYTDLPFLERFAAARAAGFTGVEMQFPYELAAAQDVAARLRETGLTQALINAPPGDSAAGERGIAALPGREREFEESIEAALDYARTLACTRVHVLAGVMGEGMNREAMRAVYVANLKKAAARFARHGIVALIEPINPRDVPGYFLSRQQDAQDVLAEVGASNLMVLMDFYHMQITEGDLATRFARYQRSVGHVQIAGVPGRNEPDTGEVNYPCLFGLLDRSGYTGWIGCEYLPARKEAGGTSAGLGWFDRYRG
jgi:hydroxypyruvate isomerase